MPRIWLTLPTFCEVGNIERIDKLHEPAEVDACRAALDGEGWSDVLGTVGGDDTILIICRSVAARERVLRRLKALAGEPG